MAPPPLLPITRLVPCSACNAHVKRGESSCPHCGQALDGRGGLVTMLGAAAMAGLLGSCISVEPLYGVMTSEPGTEGDTEAATEAPTGGDTDSHGTDTGTSADTDAATTTGTPDTGESDYGVPTTDATSGTGTGGEPDYGVPGTT